MQTEHRIRELEYALMVRIKDREGLLPPETRGAYGIAISVLEWARQKPDMKADNDWDFLADQVNGETLDGI